MSINFCTDLIAADVAVRVGKPVIARQRIVLPFSYEGLPCQPPPATEPG